MGKMKRPRVNFVLANRDPNSIAGVLTHFANHLSRKGWDVTVTWPVIDYWHYYCWRQQEDILSQKRNGSNLRFYVGIVWHFFKHFVRLVRIKRFSGGAHIALDKNVKQNRYFFHLNNLNLPEADFIVTLQECLIPTFLGLNSSKGEIISSVRTDPEAVEKDGSSMGRFYAQMTRIASRVHIRRFANSETARQSAARIGIRVDQVIHNGIDTEVFKDSGRRNNIRPVNVTCFMAIDRHSKNPTLAINAVKRVRSLPPHTQSQNVCFRCFGSNANLDAKNRQSLKMFDEVAGFLQHEDLIKMLATTDIFIFPTQYEGMPSMLLEAMASGCAAVTTAVPSVLEIGKNGVNCLLIAPDDDEAMALAVIKLIEDVGYRDKIRAAAVQTANHFTWGRAADKLADFLTEGAQCKI